MTAKLTLTDDSANPPLNITERSTPPSSPSANDIYLDDGTNTASSNPGWRRYTGSAWEDVSSASGGGGGGLYESYAILTDQKTSGTAGGASAAATWNARNLNTEVADPDSIVTIASNQLTPVAGNYELTAYADAYGANRHKLRLYNVTGTAAVAHGKSTFSRNDRFQSGTALLNCAFTANGTDAYRIDHYTELAYTTTNDLGWATSDGSTETYLTIILRKLA